MNAMPPPKLKAGARKAPNLADVQNVLGATPNGPHTTSADQQPNSPFADGAVTNRGSRLASEPASDQMSSGDEVRDSGVNPASTAREAGTSFQSDSQNVSASAVQHSALPPQLASIEVTLSVEVGSRLIPLHQLLSVSPGQLFALDRMTSEPVTILVNNNPFAKGEIVAIGDRFGVRLIDILPGGLR